MIGGEFSAALTTVGCDDWPNYSDTMKAGLLKVVLATMDALGDWFFWTWKVRLTLCSATKFNVTMTRLPAK